MIGDAPEIAPDAPQAEPPFAGQIESWFDRAIGGYVVAEAAGAPPTVEFRVGDRILGRVTADRPHGGGFGFAVTLPLEGDAVPVSAHRLPDGAALAGSPVLLYPSPMAFAGRVEDWERRAIAGHADAAEDGTPSIVEFRVAGQPIGSVRAGLPRADGRLGFRADLDIAGDGVLVSVHRQSDGVVLAGSPVLLYPGAPAPPPAAAGRIEDWFDRAISGVIAADADGAAPELDIRVAGRSVARVSAGQRRADGLFAFAAIVPVGGAHVAVSAYRVSDGRRLDPPAVLLNPTPGRVENWLGRRISGHAAPDEHGLPPTIAFRVDGETIASVAADQPRPDGYGFVTLLPIDGPAVEVSVHLMRDGRALANSPVLLHPDPPAPPPQPHPWDVPTVTLKPFVMPAHGQVALFVAHSASGVVAPHVPAYLAALREAGVAVHLIAAVRRPVDLPPALLDLVAGAMVRADAGDDFAAWSHALKLSPEIYGAGTLYLLDDSLFGPADPAGLAALLRRVRASAADLVALTASHAPRWHVQGHFLALKPRLLASAALHRFLRDAGRAGPAGQGIPADELRFGPAMEAAGHSIELLFPDALWPGRRASIADGVPFVPLKGAFSDTAGWQAALAGAGFDVPLLERTLDAAAEAVLDGGDGGLLVHAADRHAALRLLRIAFLGAWGMAGAGGNRSRAILAALRRTGTVLNLHPIGPAPGASPADAIRDFTGPADIALIHIDPRAADAPGDAVRQVMAAADRRIGYVTGPIDTLPAWMHALPPLDRIWTTELTVAAIPAGDGVPIEAVPLSSTGAAFDAAFRAALAEPPRAPAPARIGGDLARGVRFGDLPKSATLRIIPVATDGSVPPIDPAADAEATWLAFAPADALAAPHFAQAVRDHARARPTVAIFYADDVALGEPSIDQLRLKPAFDPVLLTAQDYIGWPLIVRAAAFAALGGFDAAKGAAAGDDLLFRAHARGMAIGRIPLVLLGTCGARRRVPAEVRRAMLAAQPALADHVIAPGAAPGLSVRRRRFDAATMPAVSLLIAAGGATDRLLDALAATDWPMDRLAVLVSGDTDDAESDRPFAVRRIASVPGEAHAGSLNRLWRSADTEQIVFLSGTVVPQAPGWLQALQTFALDSDVGGVGARVMAADGTLDHAGVAPIGGAAGPLWHGRRGASGTAQDWALAQREWSMVRGAVFATRRSVLEAVNGCDPRFAAAFGDYDLCLRIRGMGQHIVYTPEAAFVRTEATDEPAPAGEEIARFRGRWSAWLEADPAFHPGYDRESGDLVPRIVPDAWYR